MRDRRALMSRPKLLLMDEPSAGLAPLVVQQVFELVRRIRAEGLTVLIVEQNVPQVLEVVDRAYLLEVGGIKLAGRDVNGRLDPAPRRKTLAVAASPGLRERHRRSDPLLLAGEERRAETGLLRILLRRSSWLPRHGCFAAPPAYGSAGEGAGAR